MAQREPGGYFLLSHSRRNYKRHFKQKRERESCERERERGGGFVFIELEFMQDSASSATRGLKFRRLSSVNDPQSLITEPRLIDVLKPRSSCIGKKLITVPCRFLYKMMTNFVFIWTQKHSAR